MLRWGEHIQRKLLLVGIIFLILFVFYLVTVIVLYKTIGNNDIDHWTSETYIQTCDMDIFSMPKNCKMETLPTWCESHGGTWDASIRACNDISYFACNEARDVSYHFPNCFVPRTMWINPISHNQSKWYIKPGWIIY